MLRKCFIRRPELILLKENFSGRRESQMEAQRCGTKDGGQNKYMGTCKCVLGFPGSSGSAESACNAEDLGSIPGLGRFPWRKERLPTAIFWPGESHGLYSPWGRKESDMTKLLSPTLKVLYSEK